MLNISKAFGTSSETVGDFFQRPGVGYYIPLYQREYSWDRENVNQLLEDISDGVEALLSSNDAIRFLGTLILLRENNPIHNIKPQDHRALPTSINNVIDGQQRIATIALLSCLVYQRIASLSRDLPEEGLYDGLREASNSYLASLIDVFSLDLRRGNPTRKPIIIRGSADSWTFDGDNSFYSSDVSSFLAQFVRSVMTGLPYPASKGNSLVSSNIRLMNRWLDAVQEAHTLKSDDFPPAARILQGMSQADLWSYDRPELKVLVEPAGNSGGRPEARVCSLVQLFAFTHYLLRRCCFTLIEPVSEDWAFDMFQSLNGTGTPLTALETFKPLVVNMTNSDAGSYKGSKPDAYFSKVDGLMADTRSAAQKAKITAEFLTTLALAYDGTKLSSHFSVQRKWLMTAFGSCGSSQDREEMIRQMGDLADYWRNVLEYDPQKLSCIPNTDTEKPALKREAAISVLYLKDAGHKMAHSILSRFYAIIGRQVQGGAAEFLAACRAIAAFFTIWRSALPNTGLDDFYRKLLREEMSWRKLGPGLTADMLKVALTEALDERGIGTKEQWLPKAVQNLRYDNIRTVCRFSLFLAAHDTISDADCPGIMKEATSGSAMYLEPTLWLSAELKTLEHIAPQNKEDGTDWDKDLYVDDAYHSIGNLTMLPADINSIASNHTWLEKWIYYRHLAETDPLTLDGLQQEAEGHGLTLKQETLTTLRQSEHKRHMTPIVALGADGHWNKSLVAHRSVRICEIVWSRLNPWLWQ